MKLLTRILPMMFLLLILYPVLANSGNVEIVITGFKNNEGQVIIKVFRGPEGFPKEDELAYKIYKVSIIEMQSQLTIDLPAGEYAIMVVHDENNNELLDTNFIGMPKEAVGVSIYTKMGKPNYEKAKFKVEGSGKMTLDIIVDTIF